MANRNGHLIDEIQIDVRDLDMRFTPRELKMIREHTGRSYSAIMQDEESDDRFTVAAWLVARRNGRDLSWEDMEDMVISITNLGAAAVDPTNGQPAITSLSSAGSTG